MLQNSTIFEFAAFEIEECVVYYLESSSKVAKRVLRGVQTRGGKVVYSLSLQLECARQLSSSLLEQLNSRSAWHLVKEYG